MKISKIIISVFAILLTSVAVIPPQTVDAAAGCSSKVFRKGDTGKCVKYIQTFLNALESNASQKNGNKYAGGYYVAVDGIYGTNTYNNVKVAQRWFNSWHSSKFAVDGIVGSDTWSIFRAYVWLNTPRTSWEKKACAIPENDIRLYE